MRKTQKHYTAKIPDAIRRGGGSSEQQAMLRLAAEVERRQCEALRLYEPGPVQEEFHRSQVRKRIVAGGNQSGKSFTGYFELARAVTGLDPYNKYPKTGGIAAVIGVNHGFIGRVTYPALFKAGYMKMIRDEKTGAWRTWKPWLPGDMEREKEKKPAPPLIPPRYIKQDSWAWILQRAGQFIRVEMQTEWTLYAFSSDGVPPAGFQADLILVDEDIQNEEWIHELLPRLMVRNGRFIWTTMPYAKNDVLQTMLDDAEAQEILEVADRTSQVFRLSSLENRYVPEAYRTATLKDLELFGEDVVRQRIYGESAGRNKMFPEFSGFVHGIEEAQLPENRSDWCRYMAVDPGYSIAAAMIVAIPPDGSMVLLEDEVYLTECTAAKLARAVKNKLVGKVLHKVFIDQQGSQGHTAGEGMSNLEHYRNAFRDEGVWGHCENKQFLFGLAEPRTRAEAIRRWIGTNQEGVPLFRFIRGRVPNFEREVRNYRRKVKSHNGAQIVTDDPVARNNHLMDCWGYLASANLSYRRPKLARKGGWSIMDFLGRSSSGPPSFNLTTGEVR